MAYEEYYKKEQERAEIIARDKIANREKRDQETQELGQKIVDDVLANLNKQNQVVELGRGEIGTNDLDKNIDQLTDKYEKDKAQREAVEEYGERIIQPLNDDLVNQKLMAETGIAPPIKVEVKSVTDPLIALLVVSAGIISMVNDLKNDAAKEWEKDINEKEVEFNKEEVTLKKSYHSEMKSLEENKVRQEIDAKKFPDSEKKLELLKTLEKVINDEAKNIENKFNKGIEEINKEKESIQIEREAFQKAIATTKPLEEKERPNKIQELRQEFERRHELERQRNGRE